MKRVSVFLVAAALIAGMIGCNGAGYPLNPPPSQNLEIRTWYDLDDVRDNLAGNHTLMNDLDSTTAGYTELASPIANGGKGWEPIENFIPDWGYMGFVGTFDGKGHEIRDLFINRPDEIEITIGLFAFVDEGGVIKSVGVVNATVTGDGYVGGLVGKNFRGTISNSSVIGSVSGNLKVGGLVAYNQGPVSNCYAKGNVVAGGVVGDDVSAVIGGFGVGGLVGLDDEGTVSSCYFTGNVTSHLSCVDKWKDLVGVGGLVGFSYGTVSNSYSNANVTGKDSVGGLVGGNYGPGTVTSSYSTGNVTGTSYVGGLVGSNAGDGIVNDSFWDIETSGQPTSDGGTGKNTTEMKVIATFTDTETEGLDEPWDMTAVAPGSTNTTYIWNIVDSTTYPFLSWQP